MNKAELITSMAEKSQLTKKDAESALKAFIDSVQEALENGDKVQLIGFGYLIDMVGHNLQNGIYGNNYYLNLTASFSHSILLTP